MIFDFIVVLMTKNLAGQCDFYQNTLGLEMIFNNGNNIGLGSNDRAFIILKEDTSRDSHHLPENKGSQIITFKCNGDILQYIHKIKVAGFKIRDTLELNEYNLSYLFIEDFDHNEICLEISSVNGAFLN